MKNESTKSELKSQKKLIYLFFSCQIVLTIVLIICATFGIFIGTRFLSFMEHEKEYRDSVASKYEIRLEQSQQVNTIIKQGFSLIMDQRRENRALQEKIRELMVIISKNTEKKEERRDELSTTVQREKH